MRQQLPAAACFLFLFCGCAHLGVDNITIRQSTALQIVDVVWRAALVEMDVFSQRIQHRSAPAISPDGRLLLVGTSQGRLVCLDNQTGSVLWAYRIESPSDVDILIEGDRVFIAGGDGHVYALSLRDGQLLWKKQLAKIITAAPVQKGGRLYLLSDDDELICLQVEDGQWLWRYKHPAALSGERFMVIGSSRPLVTDNAIYVSFSDGVLVKLSLDGSVLASKTLRGEKDKFFDADVDPVIAGNRLLAGSFQQGIFALNPDDLSTIWNTKLEGPSDLLVVQDKIFVTTSDSEVAALSIADGSVIWKTRVEKSGLLSAPAGYKDWLFVCSEELSFLVVEAQNGKVGQTFNPGKGCSARPAVFENHLWWISNGETAYFMKIND